MNKMLLAGSACVLMIIAGASAGAEKPAKNVSPHRHPNIAAAQRFTNDAYQKILKAQEANEFDLGGHAQKAKDLLKQASDELKEAAEYANHH